MFPLQTSGFSMLVTQISAPTRWQQMSELVRDHPNMVTYINCDLLIDQLSVVQ